MGSIYPAQIDNAISLPITADNVTPVAGFVVNQLRTVIIRLEATLGINPASIYTTVADRLNALETGSFTPSGDLGGTATDQIVIGLQTNPIKQQVLGPGQNGYVLTWNSIINQWAASPITAGDVTLAGDVTGPAGSNIISSIQGISISGTAPTANQVFEYNSGTAKWTPTTLPSSFPPSGAAGGDLSSSYPNPTVSGIYNHPVANTAPVSLAVPIWDTGLTHYDIRPLTQDDIAAGFSITSFSGGSIVEVGATVTNPSFTASYSSLPASAQISNTDFIDSPLTLSTPFTSGTIVGSFHHTSAANVTITLTAVSTSTKTATQTIAFEARSFGGVGSAGATTATASGTTAVLNSSLGTLASVGLHTSDVGQTYGPFTASAQKIYLLLVGGSHILKDPNTNTIIPITVGGPTSVSFTNQNSSVINMYLYETEYLLSATFSVLVSS